MVMIPLIFVTLVGCFVMVSVMYSRKRDIPTFVPVASQFIPICMSVIMFCLFVICGGSPAISATSGSVANSVALLWHDIWLGLLLISLIAFLLHLVVAAGFAADRKTEGLPLLLSGILANGVAVFTVLSIPPSI